MEPKGFVFESLETMGIAFEYVDHPPALTTEDADTYIEGREGVRTKTLFLCNRRGAAYYLVVMDDKKRLDMKRLEELTGEKGMKFCSEERLMNKLGLTGGSVSLFGLLNNSERDINICLDKEMLAEKTATFLANVNTCTVFISMEDLIKFVTALGFNYEALEL